jgi:hypothetical protein
MRLLTATALLLPLLSACGGPETGSDESALRIPALRTYSRSGANVAPSACPNDAPPSVTPHILNLWPPNHTLHAISADACATVADDCDSGLMATLTWATSDEPVNDIGDGNHLPDILGGCDEVKLRAERQGPKNGRVYHVGFTVEDSGGNVVEGECLVVVDHDQSAAITEDDGEMYRVDLDQSACEEPFAECPNTTDAACL